MKNTGLWIISVLFILSGLIVYLTIGRDDPKPHPILDWSKRIMGGTYRGKWMTRDEVAKLLTGGEKYRLYSQVRCLGVFQGGAPQEEGYISGDKGYRVEIRGAADHTLVDSAFAISGDWNALPRIPVRHKHPSLGNTDFLQGILKKKGISPTPLLVTSSIEIDLDNDGIQERLMTASNISSNIIDDFCNGLTIDRRHLYSMIILQKTEKNRMKNWIVAGNYHELILNEIEFVADTNGDGKMEFMVNAENIKACPAEGFSTRYQDLFEFQNCKIRKIFSNFACPI